MKHVRLKYCGFTNSKDITNAVNAGVNAIGLIFGKESIRSVTPEQGIRLLRNTPTLVQVIGVFAGLSSLVFLSTTKRIPTNVVQLHDNLPEQLHYNLGSQFRGQWLFVVVLRRNVTTLDIQTTLKFLWSSAFFRGIVLDSLTKSHGGYVRSFDWTLLENIRANGLLIGGGIKVANVTGLLKHNVDQLDIASGIETEDECGMKNNRKMKNLVSKIQMGHRDDLRSSEEVS